VGGLAAAALPLMPAPAAAQTRPAAALAGGDAAPQPWKRYSGWATPDTAQFNTLANTHASPPAPTEPRKLEGSVAGDADTGRKLVADRTRGGSCLACHVMGQAGNADLPGNVGPDLSQIGDAGRDDEWLWNYVNDARVYNPATIMPPWGTHHLFNEKEIDDIVAFLKTLKAPAKFATAVDDPGQRHAPVETRDNLDPTTNPAEGGVRQGGGAQPEARGFLGFRLRALPRRGGRALQELGGRDAALRAAPRQGARHRGVRLPPRQGHHRRQLADAERREHRH